MPSPAASNLVRCLCAFVFGSLLASAQVLADTQAPSMVNGIHAEILSNSSIRLTWNQASDNTRVTGYNIHKNQRYLATTFDPSYTDRLVRPGIAYRYQISAFDGVNNISRLSPEFRVRFTNDRLTNTASSSNTQSSSNNAAVNTSSSAGAGNSAQASSSISAPRNLSGSQVANGSIRWQWNTVAAATRYEVTVDGNYAGQTNDATFTSTGLWVGEHSLSVKAVSGQEQYSEQSETVKATVASNFQGNNNNSTATASPVNVSSNQRDNGLVDPLSWNIRDVQNKDGYTLIFSDEFNGNSLNTNRWNAQLRWDGDYNGERFEYRIINGENQFYVNPFSDDREHRNLLLQHHNPFEFNGSRMAIRSIKNPLKRRDFRNSYGSLQSIVDQQDFLSGVITTYDKFVHKYGYFEARLKIPSHVGTFPAFWLHHQRLNNQGTQRSEIDVMENLGHAPWYIYNAFHYYNNVSDGFGGEPNFIRPRPSGQIYTGTDYSLDYHTYAVDWEPGRITWYIDGRQVSQLTNSNADHEELYVLLNLAVGGDWTNYSQSLGGLGRSNNERFPANYDLDNFANPALEIDFVRVYRRN